MTSSGNYTAGPDSRMGGSCHGSRSRKICGRAIVFTVLFALAGAGAALAVKNSLGRPDWKQTVQSGLQNAVFSSNQQTQDVQNAISQYTSEKQQSVPVDVTAVPHIFFHSLINDDRAFEADVIGQERVAANNAAMTTAAEFDAMIQDLYDAGYVLVSLDDLCVKTTGDDGQVHIAPNKNLMLPEGKKALVLSEDDLSYYHSYGIGTQGYATKMVVDENGKPKCEYTGLVDPEFIVHVSVLDIRATSAAVVSML